MQRPSQGTQPSPLGALGSLPPQKSSSPSIFFANLSASVRVQPHLPPTVNDDPIDPSRLTRREKLLELAQCVLCYTEVVRDHDGRGRHRTYAAEPDAIAEAARLLAQLVLGEQRPEQPVKRAGKAPPSPRPLSHD